MSNPQTSSELILTADEEMVQMVPRSIYPESLGTSLYDWNGHDLPFDTGQFPSGFFPPTKTGYREWIRGTHTTNQWFSRGPYVNFGVGSIWFYVFFVAPLDRRGGGSEDAFRLELYDYPLGDVANGTILGSLQVKVALLPTTTPSFTVYTPPNKAFPVRAGRGYEIRVRALGGCDLEIHLLRIFANLL